MSNTSAYTNESSSLTPIYLESLMRVNVKADPSSSLGCISLAFPLGWRILISTTPFKEESFIGMLTNKEAEEIKKSINLFKKSFDNDLAKRNKILFGQ